MTSDEEIEAYTVGTPRRLDGTVTLHEYDPAWPSAFAAQAAVIRAALGGTARALEHVGSTSVPGIAAKPIIDVLLAVPDSPDEAAYVPALEAAGFRLTVREPRWHEHRMLLKRREDGDDESVNLHAFTEGCTQPTRDLIFRDWLRAHPDDRARYERTKRDLATRTWKYVQNYADAKTAVIDDIRTRCGEPPDCPLHRPRTGRSNSLTVTSSAGRACWLPML